jgi:uncharacterized phiE125 gp8 family phage protein
MNLTVVVEPPFEPVTVAQVYEHLRWDGDQEGSPADPTYSLESLVQRNIIAARTYVENVTRRKLVEQTLRLSLSNFPVTYSTWLTARPLSDPLRYIRLPCPPIIELVSVSYFDSANASTAIDASNYYVTDDLELRFATGFSAPTVYDRPDALRITYRAGYLGDGSPGPDSQETYTANIPAPLIQAVLMQAQLLLDRFNEDERRAFERARDDLLRSYVVHRV